MKQIAFLLVAILAPLFSPAIEPFTDVTEQVGLPKRRPEPPAAWTDTNRDGWPDLFVGGILWRNVRGERFRRVKKARLGGAVVWGDFDNDGYPDAFAYGRFTLHRNLAGKGFEKLDIVPNPGTHSIAAAFGDFDGDGFLDIYSAGYETPRKPDIKFRYTEDVIFRNIGGERFEEIWRTPKGERIRPARGVAPADFDEDGDLDLYISNYRLEPNHLLLNDGTGHFTDVAAERHVAGQGKTNIDRGHTIGSAWADLDSDGHLDLFVGNFSHPQKYQDRPRVYRNQGPNRGWRFKNMSRDNGIKWVESYSCPAFGDFDNDGDLDLYYATIYGGDKSVLYRNNGDWSFTDVTRQAGIDSDKTYAAAWADYDGDGYLDLCTSNRIFHNPGGKNHWLKIRLEGDGKTVNRDAIGAQVRIRLGDKVLTRQVESATGQANQNDPTLHFGLGAHTGPVELEIRWPGGKTENRQTEIDRTIHIAMQPAKGK